VIKAAYLPRSDRRRATDGHNGGVVTAEDVDWLVARLRAVVAASSAVWAARGMTLLQLTALHLISALAPVSLTDLGQTLSLNPQASHETILGSWRSHNVILFGGWCVEGLLVCPAFPLLRLVGPGRRSGRVRWWLVGLGR
jgi:hypothetical protein